MEVRKVFLAEDEIPRQWYNILADIKMNPPLGADGKPIGPDSLAPVFSNELDRTRGKSEKVDRYTRRSAECLEHLASNPSGKGDFP